MKTREKKKVRPKKIQMQQAAIKLFATYGFDRVSIIDIGNAADMNSAMVSYYFGGKMELYDSIADDILKIQNEYMKNLITIDDFQRLHFEQKIDELKEILDKFVDFFYKEISSDMLLLITREQFDPIYSRNLIEKSPWFSYLRGLLASIFGVPINSMLPILGVISIASLMASPRSFSALLREVLNEELIFKNIDMIKENIKTYTLSFIKQYSSGNKEISFNENKDLTI